MGKAALILAPFSEDALARLGKYVRVSYESWMDTGELLSPDDMVRRINDEGHSILVVEADYVFEEVFASAPRLEFLGVCRSSLGHIDVDAATEHGVLVVNTPGRNANAVAELTMGLMLSLARGIPASGRYVSEGRWEDPVGPYTHMRGTELGGKTLGLLGFGAIGRAVSKRARSFGMKVIAYDPYLGDPGTKLGGARLESLETLLEASDYLSVHTPDTGETRGLVNKDNVSLLKSGVNIINTASYWAIDEDALVDALRSGQVGAVAMDVHRTHPIPPNSPLLSMGNALLTPHIGGATAETIQRQSTMMAEDIRRYLRGRRPRRLVNDSLWGQVG